MTPERWQAVKQLLSEALALAATERNTFLQRLAAAEPELHREVDSLLSAHDAQRSFLETPYLGEFERVGPVGERSSWVGRRLGPYQLEEQIGEGGMGVVYRAVRADGLYDRQVAIKLIRSGLSTAFFLRRFDNERQILARLDHPNIARLLDGGASEEGVPYVVMEFVDGAPIDEYCTRGRLSVRDRLKLFRTVFGAVQYAHQNLIVHRDLKPGNILVTSDGEPKLVDFGIAKILDLSQESGADHSLSVLPIMTPQFASPEQMKGGPVTTTSDVYSLGVVLYKLLTGHHPYRKPTGTPQELARAVCDEEPERPSNAVRRQDAVQAVDVLSSTAALPDGSAERLSKQLRGDLDNILLVALRKEPQRRYASVEQFAEDIRRYLGNLPVSARQDTIGYRTSKFIARHRIGVAGTALATILLLAAMAITIGEARIAQRRFNDIRSLANSLIFDVHDSIRDLPGSTPARKLIVDRALQYLDSLSRESGSDFSLQRELANAYERLGLVQGHYLQNSLGDTKGSLLSYEKALSIRKRIVAKSKDWNDRLALAESYRSVANQQWALGDYSRALKSSTSAVAISEALSGAHPKDLNILKELGFDYEIAGQLQQNGYAGGGGDGVKVEEYFRKAVATDEAMLAISPDDFTILHAYATDLNHLGGVLGDGDRNLNAALEYYKKDLQIDQTLRERSPETRYARGVAVAYSHIAQTYDKLGDSAQSIENFKRGLDVSKALVLADPKNSLLQQGLAIAYANTANALSKIGRNSQSVGYIEKSDEIMRALVASSPQNVQQRGIFAALLAANGSTFMYLGRLEAALKDLDEARATFKSVARTDSQNAGLPIGALSCTEKMGEAASRAHNAKLAAEYFRQVLKEVEPELAKQQSEPNVPYLAADSYSGLGDLELQKARQFHGDPGQRRDSWIRARDWYRKSQEAWLRIEHPLPVSPSGFDAGDPVRVAKNLQLCELALTKVKFQQRIAVGTPIAARAPHKTERAPFRL